MKNPQVAEMVKKMSPKEKRAYIWEYYKIHIIGGLILVLFIVITLHSMLTKQNEYYNITYIGNYIGQSNLDTAKNKINKTVLNNDKKNVVTLGSVFNDKNSLNSNPQTLEKLAAQITAKDIDIAIVNKKFFDSNFSSGIFYNLESLNDFSSLKKSNYKFLTKTKSGHLGTYGIYIENSNVLNSLLSKNDDNILVVISTSDRKSKAVKIIKTLLTK